MTMTQAELDAWIEALLSGKYKQGKSFLHAVNKQGDHTFCCLGVLCEATMTGDKESLTSWQVPYQRTFSNRDLQKNVVRVFTYAGFHGKGEFRVLPNPLDEYFEAWVLPWWKIDCLPKWRQIYLKWFKSNHLDVDGMRVRSLEAMNDQLGLSFKEIALVLRHNVIIKKEPSNEDENRREA